MISDNVGLGRYGVRSASAVRQEQKRRRRRKLSVRACRATAARRERFGTDPNGEKRPDADVSRSRPRPPCQGKPSVDDHGGHDDVSNRACRHADKPWPPCPAMEREGDQRDEGEHQRPRRGTLKDGRLMKDERGLRHRGSLSLSPPLSTLRRPSPGPLSGRPLECPHPVWCQIEANV